MLLQVFLVISLQFILAPVRASYEFRVRVESYSNPEDKLRDGSDCDLFGGCDPYYDLFCLRDAGHPHSDTSHCSLGKRDNSVSDVHTTQRIRGMLSWPGSFQLYILTLDNDGLFNADDVLARVFAESRVEPGAGYTVTEQFSGDYVTLGLQFRVKCDDDFYGPNCTTFCQPRDDSSGHYGCSAEGALECLSGYQDPTTFCTSAICKEGCNTTGGYCDLPEQCLCREGWNGILCDQEVNACGEFPCLNEGICFPNGTENYYCVCPTGVDGEACENDTFDGCLSSPCLNGGNCTDLAPMERYACTCPFGLGGDNCTLDTLDSCLSNPCRIQEKCIDLIEGFNCTCLPGLTGESCSININDCMGVQCHENAVCVDQLNSYQCVCEMGYEFKEPDCIEVVNGTSDSQSDGSDGASTGIVAGAVVGGLLLLICILLVIMIVTLILRRKNRKAQGDDILLKNVRSKPHPYDTTVSPTDDSSNMGTGKSPPPPPLDNEPTKHPDGSFADNPLYGQADQDQGLGKGSLMSPDALLKLENPLYEPTDGNVPPGMEIYSEPDMVHEVDMSASPSAYAYARLNDGDKSQTETKALTQKGYTVLGTAGVSKISPHYGKLDHSEKSKETPTQRLAEVEGSGYDALF